MSGSASRWTAGGMVLILAMVMCAGCAAGLGPMASDGPMTLALHEGQAAPVAGTDLVIRAATVRDLTAQGCQGGPIGCRDTAQLEVTRGVQTQTVVLYRAQTELQREQGVHEARVFGYVITLADLRGQDVTLHVQRER